MYLKVYLFPTATVCPPKVSPTLITCEEPLPEYDVTLWNGVPSDLSLIKRMYFVTALPPLFNVSWRANTTLVLLKEVTIGFGGGSGTVARMI